MRIERDVTIVGGGVIGLAIGWELARRGRRVAVVERARIGGGATAVAGGMLAPAAELEGADPAFVTLALESARLYPGWVAGIEAASGRSCRHRAEGTLLVALHRDHAAELDHAARARAAFDLRAERLSASQIHALEPRITPRAIGGWILPDDHQVDPRALAAALGAALRARGALILEDTTVTRMEGSTLHLVHGGEALVLGSRDLVLASGHASNEAIPGASPGLPLRPVKGQVVRLRGETLLRHVVRTPEVYLVPRAEGELFVGATQEEVGLDASPTAGAVFELLRAAHAVLPGVTELALEAVDVGFRPALRDHLPALGALGPGRWVATGHFRNGVLLAPATARHMADALDGGPSPPFSPARFR